jgi:synaptobrevin homolog YKT6
MQFTAKLISDRSATPSRNTVKEGEYYVHCFVRHDNLVGVCLTDEELVIFIFFEIFVKFLFLDINPV